MGMFDKRRLFEKEQPETVEILGRALRCDMCGQSLFWRRKAMINSPVADFFGLGWTRRQATCLVCDRCGHVYWFLDMP
jgi:hypothetical protein